MLSCLFLTGYCKWYSPFQCEFCHSYQPFKRWLHLRMCLVYIFPVMGWNFSPPKGCRLSLCSSLYSSSLPCPSLSLFMLTLQLPSATHCVSKQFSLFLIDLLTNLSLFSLLHLAILLNMALSEILTCSSSSYSKVLSTKNLVLKYWWNTCRLY